MTKMTKLDILNDLNNYCSNPQIIINSQDIQNLSPEILAQIPKLWLDILSLGKVDFDRLRELWQPVINKFGVVFEELKKRLQGLVILLEDNQLPSLLYIFFNGEELFCHRGFFPIKIQEIPEKIKPFWLALPEDVRKLWNIHNGWVCLFSLSNGHMPIHMLHLLSQDWWGIEVEVIENLPFDNENTVIVFNYGGSGCIGFEISHQENKIESRPLVIWWNNATNPDLDDNDFWNIYNDRLITNLENYDYNKDWQWMNEFK